MQGFHYNFIMESRKRKAISLGKSFCDNLFTYLQSLDNVPDNFFSNINEMSAFIEKTSINSMKQSKITDLFAKKC